MKECLEKERSCDVVSDDERIMVARPTTKIYQYILCT